MPSGHSHHAQRVAKELSSGGLLAGIPYLSRQESAEQWLKYEHLLYSCLITGDDQSASRCLEKLEKRFGTDNEKIKSFRGLFDEARADGKKSEDLLRGYEKELATNPSNIPLAKRRIVLLRSMGRETDAVAALTKLLEISPTDIEAWSELAEHYVDAKLFSQALFCLGEVLLVQPNAWNVLARYGEVSLMSIAGEDKHVVNERLVAAMQHYARSVELCNGYIRGLCGLKQTSIRLLEYESINLGTFDDKEVAAAKGLRDYSTAQLQSAIRAYPADCSAPEVAAARLLAQ